MNYLETVVETKDIRARDGAAVDSEARVVVGDGSHCINEGRRFPSVRPVIQVGDQVIWTVG